MRTINDRAKETRPRNSAVLLLLGFMGVLAPAVTSSSASPGVDPGSAAEESLRCGRRRHFSSPPSDLHDDRDHHRTPLRALAEQAPQLHAQALAREGGIVVLFRRPR